MGIKRSTFLTAALAGSVALAACDGLGADRPSGLTLLLTDAPGDVAEAWVRIDRISLHGDGGETLLLDEQTGWIELTELAGTNTATLVEDAVVPEGRYHQMRFVIREAYLIDRDDRVYATDQAILPSGVEATGRLQCASCQTPAGLRVKLPNDAMEITNEAKIVVVDFDVFESLERPGRAGRSGQWVMTPILRATEFAVSAGLTGTVTLAEEVEFPESCGAGEPGFTHFIPRLLEDDGEVAATGSTTADGDWEIAFIHPGSYTLSHVEVVEFEGADLLIEATASPAEVTLGSGASATAAFVIESLECVELDEEGDE